MACHSGVVHFNTMIVIFVLILPFCPACSQEIQSHEKKMIDNNMFMIWENGKPVDWKLESGRVQTTPVFSPFLVDNKPNGLRLSTLPSGMAMGWFTQKVSLDKIASRWLRFSCTVQFEKECSIPNALIVLEYSPIKGQLGKRTEYAYIKSRLGPKKYRAERILAPAEGAEFLKIMLGIQKGTDGAVVYRDISLEPIAPPARRTIKVATAYLYPISSKQAGGLDEIGKLARDAAKADCDLILFGEAAPQVLLKKGRLASAEPIPGPSFEKLSKIAKDNNIFLAVGVYEKQGEKIFNTALLFDRSGKLVGKYRKVHATLSEIQNGISPGNDFPVFQTELGRIGIQICYDHFFLESARVLALKGAEIILTPIWGDMRNDGSTYEVIAKARAIDNGVFYVTSNYSNECSLIVDPFGKILARTSGKEPSIAMAELDLDMVRRRLTEERKWAYIFGPRYPMERQPESYLPISAPLGLQPDTRLDEENTKK